MQPGGLSTKTPRSSLAGERLDFLRALVAAGGPTPAEYARLATTLSWFHDMGFGEVVRRVLGPTLTRETMQGFSYLKPHGYAGDFEIIDRIYACWRAGDPALVRWDDYFHAQSAPRAVRNRKLYFARLASEVRPSAGGARILNVGCGPGRDVDEYLTQHPATDVRIDSIDMDPNAITFASRVCALHPERTRFHRVNALRFKPLGQYDVIWSAGLLDYFSDDTFQIFLRRYYRALTPGGVLVIGNFGPGNSSKAYMELVGEWHLRHRSKALLIERARSAGIAASKVCVDQEPEGVNLFLRVSA